MAPAGRRSATPANLGLARQPCVGLDVFVGLPRPLVIPCFGVRLSRGVIQRAEDDARAWQATELTCLDVLMTIFSAQHSNAAYLLSRQKISHLEVANRLRS